MNYATIKILTVAHDLFGWSCGSGQGADTDRADSLRAAVVAAVARFRVWIDVGFCAHDVRACIVLWHDGDTTRAFIHELEDEVPEMLPWVLMQG